MRRPIPLLALVLGPLMVAGCTGSETLYQHDWFYGPGYAGTLEGGDPVFRDAFEVRGRLPNVSVAIHWDVKVGHAAVLLDAAGERFNFTSRNVTGQRGSQEASLPWIEGTWGVEIRTWRTEGGVFPQGRVRLDVEAVR